MDNNKPLSAEEHKQQADEIYDDLVAKAKAGDMNATLTLMLLNATVQQNAWAAGFAPHRRVTGMELKGIGMLGLINPVKIDTSAPAIKPDTDELSLLGKYFGNAEKGVLVRVIPDEPTRFIHEAPRGLQ